MDELEEQDPRARREEGVRELVVAIGIYLVAFFILGGITGSIWIAATGQDTDAVGTTCAGLVGAYAGIGLGCWLVARRANADPREHYGIGIGPRSLLFPALVVGIGSQGFLALLQDQLTRHVDKALKPSEASLDIADKAKHDSGLAIAALFIAFALVAPVFEELFFRGLLLRAVTKRFGAPVAIGATGVLFGLTHVQSFDKAGLYTVAALSAFGVVLAVLAHKAHALGPPIVCHMAFNAISLVTLFAAIVH